MNSIIISKLEAKQFYRKLEAIFARLENAGSPRMFAKTFGPEFCRDFADFLGLHSLIAVDLLNDNPDIIFRWGAKDHDGVHETIYKIRHIELPWLGKHEKHQQAVFSVGEDSSVLISVLIDHSCEYKSGLGSHHFFSSLQYAIEQHLKRQQLEDAFEQARAIQMSLLPPGEIQFGPYEIAAISVPAHSVGGDIYDFQKIDSETLSIAIGDAAGHGLPAALQARDLMVGLRMGLELESDISKIVQKLNRVIYRNGLASRFASLLFGTIRSSGDFTYINAGHPPPLLLDQNGFHELTGSNMILGPHAESDYRCNFTQLAPGSLLLLYTDGLLEHMDPNGAEFGIHGLSRWMIDWKDGSASRAVVDLMERLHNFSHNHHFRDDVTAILIHRRA